MPSVDSEFVKNLNDAAEAWYVYADRVFGPCDVEIDAGLYDARYLGRGVKMRIRKDLDTHRRAGIAWTAFTDAFLLARGHTYDPVAGHWRHK